MDTEGNEESAVRDPCGCLQQMEGMRGNGERK